MRKIFVTTAIVAVTAAAALAHGGHASGGPGGTYTVKAGDTLAQIAQSKLGNASHWREIAELNGVRDARRLAIGTVLRLPGGAPAAGNAQLVGEGRPIRDREFSAPTSSPATSSPTTPQEPIATDRDTQREPEARARLAPAHPTHPVIEERATSYPAAEQKPIGEARGGVRRHRHQHDHTLMPADRTPDDHGTGSSASSYPVFDQEPIATDRSTRRRPEPSGGRLTTGSTDRGAHTH